MTDNKLAIVAATWEVAVGDGSVRPLKNVSLTDSSLSVTPPKVLVFDAAPSVICQTV